MRKINLDIDREIIFEDSRLSPDQKLCYAMLERALYDVFSNSLSEARLDTCHRMRFNRVKAAYLWLMKDPIKHKGGLTARMCCEALGMDLNNLRAKIAQHRKQPSMTERVELTYRHGRQIKFISNKIQ